ncbi:MAG: GAF domain-containing protein [Caldilineaceae bacterium]
MKNQPAKNGKSEPTPTLLTSLIELQQLLRNSDTRLYWERCAEVLTAHTSVKALSLWLFRIHTAIPDVSVRLGKFDSTWLARIQRWEMALRSYSSEEFQATASDDVELGLGRRDEDQPIIHMRLRLDGILLGGISLVFAPDDLPDNQDYGQLLQFVQLIVDNGLRARQLTITRQRLEQMSLIAQVSQSLNSTLELETVLRDTTEMSAMTLQSQAATLFVVDERNRELIFYMPTGTAGGMLHEMRIPQHQGVAGWVSMNRRSIIVNNVEETIRASPRWSTIPPASRHATSSVCRSPCKDDWWVCSKCSTKTAKKISPKKTRIGWKKVIARPLWRWKTPASTRICATSRSALSKRRKKCATNWRVICTMAPPRS